MKFQFEFMLSIQRARFNERLRRKPFLKIVEGTENILVPLCYDPRTEDEVMTYIKLRMRRKLLKRQRVFVQNEY